MDIDLKSGQYFYSMSGRVLRWNRYKENAPYPYCSMGGRWQESNGYGGWKNCKYDPEKDPPREFID